MVSQSRGSARASETRDASLSASTWESVARTTGARQSERVPSGGPLPPRARGGGVSALPPTLRGVWGRRRGEATWWVVVNTHMVDVSPEHLAHRVGRYSTGTVRNTCSSTVPEDFAGTGVAVTVPQVFVLSLN